MIDKNEKYNKSGCADPTAYAAFKSEERKQRAFYVFRTMISVARLGGFFVNDNLVIEDSSGTKYKSNDILKTRKKHDV